MSVSTGDQILSAIGPHCRDAGRRELLLARATLNGIDFIEFEEMPASGRHVLHVHFLNDIPPGAYGLLSDAGPLRIHGGTRIVGIAVTTAALSAHDPKILDVDVDQQGDFSAYVLSIGWSREDPVLRREDSGEWTYDVPVWRFNGDGKVDGIDRLFSVAPVNFRPDCPIDVDCAPVSVCPPDVPAEPALDYLAKDYASFRKLMLDLVAQRNPSWTEQSPADIGMALLELFAHEGDHLSYLQDAVANEAFLDTARQRTSAKRHAKLVDYQMHDGRNAWTYVQFNVSTPGTIGSGTQVITRITAPLRLDRIPGKAPSPPTSPPGPVLNPITTDDFRTDPALRQVRVFETAATVAVDPRNNELRLHTWGNDQCCLPPGTTSAHLYAIEAGTTGAKAVRPPLQVGDLLLFEEVLGPVTGAAADADPTHRQVVRIETVTPDPSASAPAGDRMGDPLFLAAIDPANGEPTLVRSTGPTGPILPLVEVTWSKADALTFPLCLSARLAGGARDGTIARNISIARGNITLADDGRSVCDEFSFQPPLDGAGDFRPRLSEGPLTVQAQPDPEPRAVLASAVFPPSRERANLACGVHEVRPGVVLRPAVTVRTTQLETRTATWLPVPDLLSSRAFDRRFVADLDNTGRAVLRFGDGEYGRTLAGIDHMTVCYRVGNGRAGNVGAEALVHIVRPNPVPAGWPDIDALRNPLPARDGVDPELIEEVRQYAPAAFRARQFRAVTERDYRDAALTISGVEDAVASFRWIGSWYTVFVGIKPADPASVVTNPRGITTLAPGFKQHVLDGLTRFRLAGYDLELRAGRYVPLDVAIQLCARPGYFSADVAHAVSLALSAGVNPDGTRGFFHPANLTFGQPVYLSQLYAAVENVAGVESATITDFHRHGRDPAHELENGSIPIGAWEIARLDNDRSNLEQGTLTISAGGGR